METCWELIPALPESIHLIWRNRMDEGGRQSNDTNQRPQGIARFLGAAWGMRPSSLFLAACTPGLGTRCPWTSLYSLSPDGLTRGKAKVLLPSWGGQGCWGPDHLRLQEGPAYGHSLPDDPQPEAGAVQGQPPRGGVQAACGRTGLRRLARPRCLHSPTAASCQCQPGESAPQVRAAETGAGTERRGRREEEGALWP